MTIDEKIEQNIGLQSKKFYPVGIGENFHDQNLWPRIYLKLELFKASKFVKSEMLSDMQKLVEALKFYADMAKDDNQNLDDCLERACIDRAESKEYNLGGKYVAEKAVKALAEFNAKYKEQK